jgi:TetR/AcrR family transcriptional regulator, mexJK operon transcriptional repressor
MESVAAAASVSKVTIFNHFRDKGSLLEATVEREANRLEGAVFADDSGGDAIARLTDCGEALLRLLASPDVLALDRVLGVEPYRGSEVARRFFAAGPKRGRAIVTRLVVEAAEQGTIQIDDPQQAAEDLLALWLGSTWREEIALGLRKPPGKKQISALVQRGLDGFLRMYGRADRRRT